MIVILEEPKTPEEPRPWTTEEQKVLEQSLKTYNQTTPDRWNKIAECLPNRSKKECMMRFKVILFNFRNRNLKQLVYFLGIMRKS